MEIKKVKIISAAALAAILTVSSSAAVFAANDYETLTNGVVGTHAGTALNKKIQLEKELVVYNQDETTIAEPDITYTYTLTAGSAGKQVTDIDSVSVKTKAGVLPDVKTATVVYNNSDITAAPYGASNKKNFSFDFSDVNYTAAGVYRYVVTETTNTDKISAGITDGTISDVRYLDVYVRDENDGETGRQIYGYVLFSNDNDIDGRTSASKNTVTNAVKTTGFVAATGPDGSSALTADQYYTYNVTVSKTLVNDSANNSHVFPFNVDFTNNDVTRNVLLKQTTNGTVTAAAPTAAAASSLDSTPSIANGGSVKYIGIPAGTKLDVYETNNVEGTTYKSEYSIDSAAKAGGKNITWTGDAAKSNTAELTTTADTKDTTAHTVAFTNTLELISPTGVVFRFAPFILLAGFGVFFLIFSRRNRNEKDKTDVI